MLNYKLIKELKYFKQFRVEINSNKNFNSKLDKCLILKKFKRNKKTKFKEINNDLNLCNLNHFI